MTQELYQKAMKFAGEKHQNQKVPGTNSNYLLHISNVAMEILLAYHQNPNFDLDFTLQTAILHDTIEDTDTTFKEIKLLFGNNIAKAVQALSKNAKLITKKEKIMDSLFRINELNKEVGMVKIADRITNLQTPPKHWNKEKIINYIVEAKLIATSLKNTHDYLNKRLDLKIKEYENNI